MKIYSQRDSRWGEAKLGFSNTKIKDAGCFLTALSMMVGRTPLEVNILLKNAGAFTRDLIISKKAAEILGLDYLGVSVTPASWVPSIIEVDSSPSPGKQQHFVVNLGGTIVDPWTGTELQLNKYPHVTYRLFKNSNTPMEKTYDIKSELNKELEKRWDNFNDEKGDDHKKMAEILQEERHASEYSADTINKLEIEVNDLKKSVTIAENSIIVKIETIEELEDVVRVQTETIKKLEKQIAEGKEPGVLEKAWIFMVKTLWAKKPKDK